MWSLDTYLVHRYPLAPDEEVIRPHQSDGHPPLNIPTHPGEEFPSFSREATCDTFQYILGRCHHEALMYLYITVLYILKIDQ